MQTRTDIKGVLQHSMSAGMKRVRIKRILTSLYIVTKVRRSWFDSTPEDTPKDDPAR